ncbi:MAG: hypothetical protein OEV55_03120 [candidate division Zixibacteria bacterium]|nr:hypothetical protein [candidate division Zixibacteria bacterium]
MEKKQTKGSHPDKISFWLLLYAFSYACFHIIPVFLNYEIVNKLLIADLLDMLTPFVMIFLIYILYRILSPYVMGNSDSTVKSKVKILLIFGAITFVEGHGMHLSSNALSRHLMGMKDFPVYNLNYFFDEILSHIFWDGGIVLLSIGLILLGFNLNQKEELNPKPVLIVFAFLLYGFTFFVNAVEGQTIVFTFPLAIILPLSIWLVSSHKGNLFTRNAVLSFYFFAYILALGLFIFWGISQNGFPQFSELGWI